MNNLNFNTGYVAYNLNDAVEIHINPTDAGFVKKLYNAFDELQKKQTEYRGGLENATPAEVFDICDRINAEMRTIIDGLFDVPVCDALFGSMNVYAMADGLPVWCNLLLAIIDETDARFSTETKHMSNRVKEYTAKYRKKK